MSDKDGAPKNKTLSDDEIVKTRCDEHEEGVSRRSMLAALGVLAGGAAAAILPGCVVRRPAVVYTQPAPATARYRTGVTDADGGPYADPGGYGRGQRASGYTGLTDSDGGPYADPGGHGRGVYGRSSGVTDSDGGRYADPVGNGRGGARGGHTGITDSDGGPYADPAGAGRGRW